MSTRNLQLYITTESPCGYFDDRKSSNLVLDPDVPLTMPIYSQLIQHGFRRSGADCYRPHCPNCNSTVRNRGHQSCIACRLVVNEFTSNRSQRRCLKTNEDIKLTYLSAGFTEEYLDLYNRYLKSRHGDGTMANPTEDDFKQFLYCNWSDTQFLEFRLSGKLVAIAVTDIVSDGLSAVYSFFDPELASRSLGTYCILKQIDYAKELALGYVYLGYWINGHDKMHYKVNFKPLQLYIGERWFTSN
ncbi:MAG: arginyltransferase [Gammaproteobacteria bacterium]|nr:arginyltransferase [Gammaproteobacteria bacterium]